MIRGERCNNRNRTRSKERDIESTVLNFDCCLLSLRHKHACHYLPDPRVRRGLIVTLTLTLILIVFVIAMFVKYVLLVNKQGQTRVSQYYEHLDLDERATLEPDIVRRCLSRSAGLVRRMIDDQ